MLETNAPAVAGKVRLEAIQDHIHHHVQTAAAAIDTDVPLSAARTLEIVDAAIEGLVAEKARLIAYSVPGRGSGVIPRIA